MAPRRAGVHPRPHRRVEAYRLRDADLAFGELLPQMPGWMEQDEYERETSVGFNLERLTKEIGRVVPALTHVGNRPDRDE